MISDIDECRIDLVGILDSGLVFLFEVFQCGLRPADISQLRAHLSSTCSFLPSRSSGSLGEREQCFFGANSLAPCVCPKGFPDSRDMAGLVAYACRKFDQGFFANFSLGHAISLVLP